VRKAAHSSRKILDATSFASFVLALALLPISMGCVIPVGLLLELFVPGSLEVVVALWLSSAGLLFSKRIVQLVAFMAVGARRLTVDEDVLLRPLWAQVTRRAGLPADRYLLRVVDSNEINAAAVGRHIVCITGGALRSLPADELTGVLAHELGHHMRLHTAFSVYLCWVLLPMTLWARIGEALSSFYAALTSGLSSLGMNVVAGIAAVFGFLFAVLGWALRLPEDIAMSIKNTLSRHAEYRVDAFAANVGYGPQLIRALRRFEEIGKQVTAAGQPAMQGDDTHPALPLRIKRLSQ